MDYNQRNHSDDDFLDNVNFAIHTGNFMDISRYVGDLVNQTIDAARASIPVRPRPADRWDAPPRPNGPGPAIHAGRQAEPALSPRAYTRHPPGRLANFMLIVFGYLIFGISGLILLIFAISAATIGGFAGGVVTSAIFTALGLAMGIIGMRRNAFIRRFLSYTRNLGDRTFVPVSDLASRTGKTISFTIQDLQKMISSQLFYEAHVDPEGGYLILTDQAYAEYQSAKTAQTARQREMEQTREDTRLTEECRKMIEQGQKYVAHIRASNDQIPDAEFSAKLDKMEQVVRKIFDVVRVHPEVAGDLRKMMDYYLPTTAKLLDAYRELDSQPVGGEHIDSTKKEIEGAVDTLNTAFEQLLDNLFADRAWDISSDISVLNTVLAQDGLGKKDLK